ncbi:MAG TPA: O-antigen ligase family protein, partial [Leptolinea sp.]
LALLGILIATSSIVFEDQLPVLSVGVSFHIPDILLLGSLGLILIRGFFEPDFKIVRTPLDWAVLLFIGVTLLSTFIALYQSSVDAIQARRWIRILCYYLTFFIVTNLVRDRRQLDFLLNGIFFLASVVAAAMAVQFMLGSSVQLLPGRVEILDTQGIVYENVTRILPPGYSIVLVSFVTILSMMVLEKSKSFGWLRFLECGLLGMAILATFLRSYWAAIIVAFILLVYLARGKDRQRLVHWGLITVLVGVVILLLSLSGPDSRGEKLISASLDRLTSLGKTSTFAGQDSSVNWRLRENEYALISISQHPWLGQGMGFTYRPFDNKMDQTYPLSGGFDFRQFIHNGHFWIMLQSGLIGYGIFMWLSLSFLVRGFKYWRSITEDRYRGVVLGFTLVYLAILIAAVVNSTFMQWYWAPILGIMMGTNEVIYAKFRQPETVF